MQKGFSRTFGDEWLVADGGEPEMIFRSWRQLARRGPLLVRILNSVGS